MSPRRYQVDHRDPLAAGYVDDHSADSLGLGWVQQVGMNCVVHVREKYWVLARHQSLGRDRRRVHRRFLARGVGVLVAVRPHETGNDTVTPC